jgi:hypothetical protein
MSRGEIVYGELSSADASTATALTLYDTSGNARALAATETLVITDASGIFEVEGRYDLFQDIDDDGVVDAGERIVGGEFGATGGFGLNWIGQPRQLVKGITPKVLAEAPGQVDVVIAGYILKS